MSHENPIHLGILISGSGSTMERIILETKNGGRLQGKVLPKVVISSRDTAGGKEKAEKLGVPVEVVRRKDYEKGAGGSYQFGESILSHLRKYEVTHVSQNGWLPLTPSNVIDEFEGRIFNQHPGPLDPDHISSHGEPLQFGGKGMHGKAVASAVLKFQELVGRVFPHEATIHRVSPNVDGGSVVFRKEIDILPNDTAESLASRLLPIEHELQIEFWEQVSHGEVEDLHRKTELIQDSEEQVLQVAKIYAREEYPNG